MTDVADFAEDLNVIKLRMAKETDSRKKDD
jgi:hypothetical protein